MKVLKFRKSFCLTIVITNLPLRDRFYASELLDFDVDRKVSDFYFLLFFAIAVNIYQVCDLMSVKKKC